MNLDFESPTGISRIADKILKNEYARNMKILGECTSPNRENITPPPIIEIYSQIPIIASYGLTRARQKSAA